LIVPTVCVFPGKPDLQMEKGYTLQLVRMLRVIPSSADSARGHPFPEHTQPRSLSKEERTDFNQPLWLHFLQLFGVWSLFLSPPARKRAASAPSEPGRCGRRCFGGGFGLVPALATVVLGRLRHIGGIYCLSSPAVLLRCCRDLPLGCCCSGCWERAPLPSPRAAGSAVIAASPTVWPMGLGAGRRRQGQRPGSWEERANLPVGSCGCPAQTGRPRQPHRAPLGLLRDLRTRGPAGLAAGPAHARG